jgi:methyl-accepting chemotaxis protein
LRSNAGKGFAGLASEMKSLSSQTDKATKDSSSHIGLVQEATRRARADGSVVRTDHRRNKHDRDGHIHFCASARRGDREIAPKVQASAQGIHEVSTDIGGVKKSAGETGRAAGHVLAATNDLALQPAALRRQVDDFLGSIRAVRASAPDPSAAKDGVSIEPLPTHAGGRDG